MTNAAEEIGGVRGNFDAGKSSITTRGTDLLLTNRAATLRLHHVLVRRRRWSKALDRLLAATADPWEAGRG